jgi:hypothetical protein
MSTSSGYRLSGNWYAGANPPIPLPYDGVAHGSDSVSLTYSGSGVGPGSMFHADGTAIAHPLRLKASSSIGFTHYFIGSYVGAVFTGAHFGLESVHSIPAGESRAEATDEVIVVAPPADYYVIDFNYSITGSAGVTPQHVHSRAYSDFEVTAGVALNGQWSNVAPKSWRRVSRRVFGCRTRCWVRGGPG